MTQNGKYCPAAGSMCAMLKTCCTSLGSGGQTACLNTMTSAANDSACTLPTNEYCPPSATEPNCVAFAACCAQFGNSVGASCYSFLIGNMDYTGAPATNNSNCMPGGTYGTTINQYCPTMTNCTKLLQCCANKPATCAAGVTGCITRDQCEQQVVSAQNNDTTCISDLANDGC
jgi:hypothetical protein